MQAMRQVRGSFALRFGRLVRSFFLPHEKEFPFEPLGRVAINPNQLLQPQNRTNGNLGSYWSSGLRYMGLRCVVRSETTNQHGLVTCTHVLVAYLALLYSALQARHVPL
jgi:hypothetical protein